MDSESAMRNELKEEEARLKGTIAQLESDLKEQCQGPEGSGMDSSDD